MEKIHDFLIQNSNLKWNWALLTVTHEMKSTIIHFIRNKNS